MNAINTALTATASSVGVVSSWYLANAATSERVRLIADGEIISRSGDEAFSTVCVEIEGNIAALQMSLDGSIFPYQMLPPFCLGASSLGLGAFGPIDELQVAGSYRVEATPYQLFDGSAIAGKTESITITISDDVESTFLPQETVSITGFYLVDASADRFVKYIVDGEVIDLKDGDNLNICADALANVGSVQMSLNGVSYPHHNLKPFCLGADNAQPPATFEAVPELAAWGTYSIQASPYSENNLQGSAGASTMISVSIVDSAFPSSQPSLLPSSPPTIQPSREPSLAPSGAPIALPKQDIGEIGDWYLTNAATEQLVRYMVDGDIVDIAVEGTELNLCVDTLGDVDLVEIRINGAPYPRHAVPPFCLGPDEAGLPQSYEPVPELAAVNSYVLQAIPFANGIAGNTSTISISVIDSDRSSTVQGVGALYNFFLVDAARDVYVRNIAKGETINLSTVGASLNICVEASAQVASVEMTLNGKKFDYHNVPPFCLGPDAQDPTQNYEAVAELASIGTFSVTATPYVQDDLVGDRGHTKSTWFTIVSD